jgi:glycosyltransferase involved in cell wall biosynthesis
MAQYGLLARNHCENRNQVSKGSRVATILDAHNALFQVFERLSRLEGHWSRRWLMRREAGLLARYETEIFRQFDHITFVTDQDRQSIQNLMTRGISRATSRNGTIPNTQYPVHNSQFSTIPICIDPVATPAIPRLPPAFRVTFMGALHWPPNAEGIEWFAREVWPLIRQRVPRAVLTVIGKRPPASLTGIAGGAGDANGRPAIDLTGYMGDPTPYLAETAVFIVPLRSGGGMRVKILDAWCWGLPVVSTRIGAEGIQYRADENILVADAPTAFAEAVVRLLTRAALNEAVGSAGRRWVEERYDWRKVYAAWDEIYR